MIFVRNLYLKDKTILILSFFVLITPLALIIGPAIADWCASLIGIIFIIYSIKKRKFNLYNTFFFKIIISWTIYLIIRSLFTQNPYLSLESSLFYFRFVFFCLGIIFILQNNYSLIKLFTNFLLLIFSVILFDSYFQYINGYNIIGYKYDPNIIRRLSSFFKDELILGSYLSKFFPLLCGLLLFTYNKKGPLIITILTPLTIGAIILSGERSALFIILIFFIFYIFLTFKNLIKFNLISLLLTIIIFATLLTIDKHVKYRVINFTLWQINIENLFNNSNSTNTQSDKINIFSQEHESHIKSAWSIFLDHKFFGIGPKMFREICSDEKYVNNPDPLHPKHACSTHPHNYYIQLLSETGIIGSLPIFFAYFYFIILFIRISLNKNKKDQYIYIFFISIIILFFPLMPTGNFFNNWLSTVNFFLLGFVLYFLDIIKNGQ